MLDSGPVIGSVATAELGLSRHNVRVNDVGQFRNVAEETPDASEAMREIRRERGLN